MKLRRLGIALVGRRCARRGGAAQAQEKLTVWWVKGFYKSRRRRAVRGDQEVRGEDRRQGRALAVPGAGHDPEDGRRARCRHAARRRLCRRLRLPGRRQVGVRRQARGPLRHHHADEGQVPQEHDRDDVPVQRQDQEEARTTRSRSSSRRCTSSTGRTCWRRRATRSPTSRPTWKAYWDFWCDKVQPAHRKKTGKRTYAIGQPMGVDSSRLVLLVPDVHGRATTSSWSTTTASCWSTIRRSSAGLINALRDYTEHPHARLHAAVVDELEGSRTTTSPSTTRRS